MRIHHRIIFLVLYFATFACLAQLPDARTINGIRFITGGIGSDVSKAMQAEAKQWPLLLEFSQADGQAKPAWVAGVKVVISDAKNAPLLETVCDGPLMLVKLPPGSYSIAASYNGMAQNRTLVIAKDMPQRIVITWKSPS
ncbi:carboxypeptidase regulatory-like domain-containing protein [Polynucleobacter sp. IMCC 30228]|uniref:carboxypeptidase regulatory-like domain-containing protein n=1 Tax=Polynucleobacter sp. IMCC 30228 TaxID=2781011 RepID=UPI001F24A3FF|nr:carboxypeptidase regulatory-like domain-containing protein [Polynucleobacter sp. IMCC 30228]MCE7527977.1 carboxypeptidase regulatory-like domain-containing protein [Polynucleobacter sp. IMCC 30228]